MIRAEDAEFHAPESADPLWAETNFFGFYNAAEHLNVGVYGLFRPNLGVVHSTISMNSGQSLQPWAADFCDHRAHLPLPASLLDYTLANGLSVQCLEPNTVWRIRYDDGAGTRIDVTYRSLMPPFDIQDPEQDPITAAKTAEPGFAWGTAYNGHFDQTGQYTGEVVLRGRAIPIDCVSTMDHSWGPRPERGGPNMSWMHAHFSPAYALHLIWSFDHADPQGDLQLNHGYALVDGAAHGLVSGTGRTVRDEHLYARSVELEVTDVTGRTHRLAGEGLTRFPWQAWPNMVGFNALLRWQAGEQVGYGETQDFVDLTRLTAFNAQVDALDGRG